MQGKTHMYSGSRCVEKKWHALFVQAIVREFLIFLMTHLSNHDTQNTGDRQRYRNMIYTQRFPYQWNNNKASHKQWKHVIDEVSSLKTIDVTIY